MAIFVSSATPIKADSAKCRTGRPTHQRLPETTWRGAFRAHRRDNPQGEPPSGKVEELDLATPLRPVAGSEIMPGIDR